MFILNDDKSIYATRGDIVFFSVSARTLGDAEADHEFQAGDLLRMKIFGKKNADNVVLQKEFPVTDATKEVEILLTKEDTKIGDVISKPADYWYEIELNPYTNPQTLIGYDEDGAKVFKLFPEGADIPAFEPTPEDIPFIDDELDLTSTRPVQNQAIARAKLQLDADITHARRVASSAANDVAIDRARINQLIAGTTPDGAEILDVRVGANGTTYKTAGEAVREQIKNAKKEYAYGHVFLNQEPTFTFVKNSYLELTLNGRTEVFYNGTYKSVNDAYAKHTFSDNSALFAIAFNYETSEILIQHFSSKLPADCVLIGTAYEDILNLNLYGVNKNNMSHIDAYEPASVSVFCDVMPSMTYTEETAGDVYSGHITLVLPKCTVNTGYKKFDIYGRTVECDTNTAGVFNILYNKKKDEVLLEHRMQNLRHDYYQIGIVHTASGVYLNGCNHLTKPYNMSVAPLVLGWSNTFVEFDSVNKTITFPDDTLIQFNRSQTGRKHYQLTNSAGNTTASWAHLTTSALVVIFDTISQTLEVIPYNKGIWDWQIVIASFRTSCGQVSINAPYKWDGKPFNMSPDDLGVDTLSNINYKVKAVNHRGYSAGAPENTLAAYRLSAKNKFEYVECDISFTSDGVAVLLHDDTIDRTSNGTGKISNMTLAEARNYDYGSWFSSEYSGEKIPTAEEFIALCRKLSLHPYIELKSGTEAQINSLVNIVKKYGMLRNVTWISFNATTLDYVKAVDPVARLGFIVSSITAGTITTARGLQNDVNEVFVDAGADSNIQLCIDANIPVERWTVNGDAAVLSLNPYVSGVTSDNVHAGMVLYKAEIGK